MTNQPKVCGTCGSDDPELYGGDCFLYPGPHDAFHDTPASEPPRFMWCCRRCSAHVETDGKGVPQCGTCGSDMVRYRLDTPASEPGLYGDGVLPPWADRASEPTPSEDVERIAKLIEQTPMVGWMPSEASQVRQEAAHLVANGLRFVAEFKASVATAADARVAEAVKKALEEQSLRLKKFLAGMSDDPGAFEKYYDEVKAEAEAEEKKLAHETALFVEAQIKRALRGERDWWVAFIVKALAERSAIRSQQEDDHE